MKAGLKLTRSLSIFVMFISLGLENIPAYASVLNDSVTVTATSAVGVIPATAFGLNTGVYDPKLLDSSVPQLLKNSDVGVLRFPGGSIADAYHWSSNSITTGYANNAPDYFTVAPGNSFGSFMGLVQKINGQAMITVNYGSNANGKLEMRCMGMEHMIHPPHTAKEVIGSWTCTLRSTISARLDLNRMRTTR